MSRTPAQFSVDRITVAFAANESPSHVIETITQLAGGYKAEVSCVFIEDADMLSAAGLPFALEVCRTTNVVRRVSTGDVERGLKERAAVARKLVAETAKRTGAKWSFEVLRQRTASALLDLAKKSDMMIFAAAAPLRSSQMTRPNTRRVMHQPPPGESIVVLIDRSAASGRALQVAQKLAEIRNISLQVVVVAQTTAGLDRLRGQLERTGRVDASNIISLCRPQISDVAAAACAARPATLVLPIPLIAGSSERIR